MSETFLHDLLKWLLNLALDGLSPGLDQLPEHLHVVLELRVVITPHSNAQSKQCSTDCEDCNTYPQHCFGYLVLCEYYCTL